MTCKRGDVVLVVWPSRKAGGYKHRPAVIVQADELAHDLSTVLVVPLTSQVAKRDLGCCYRVRVAPGTAADSEMGLRTDTVILVDQTGVVYEREVTKRIGSCPAMEAVDTALRRVFGL